VGRLKCLTWQENLPLIPTIRFFVNEYVNLYYHLSVLFSEYFSDEESVGFLNNSVYRQKYRHLKTEKLHQLFQSLQQYSFYAWDFAGKSLFEANTMDSAAKILKSTSQKIAEIWFEIYSEAFNSYEDVWAQTKIKLKECAQKFKMEWDSISASVLSRMSSISKCPWKHGTINVHFVDCICGASAWVKDIALAPFPDIDVEKKLLSHELAHTLVPDHFLKTKLRDFGLDLGLSHSIVDLIAYFSVKDHVTDLERRGIRPNPDYYEQVERLYPIFEDCYKYPRTSRSFDEILGRITRPS
jgi:hypothetical protein